MNSSVTHLKSNVNKKRKEKKNCRNFSFALFGMFQGFQKCLCLLVYSVKINLLTFIKFIPRKKMKITFSEKAKA